MPIIEIRNLTKTYRQGDVEVHALQEISLSVEPGEFAAIAGPSGSGKTTLLNIIGGLDSADAGFIAVDGNDYGKMKPAEMAELRLHRIGFVFQAYNLIPVLSALENVEFVMLLQGIDKAQRRRRAMTLLEEVGLADHHDRRPAALSGGQQQRVAVARAVASAPAIVLADEPTANLDSETGKDLIRMMLQLNRSRNVTFIFSTHDAMVMDQARRLVSLRDGRVAGDRVKHE